MVIRRASQADDDMPQPDLVAFLRGHGVEAIVIAGRADLDFEADNSLFHIALVNMDALPLFEVGYCVQACSKMKLPVIALVPERYVAELDATLDIEDFVLSPPNLAELATRADRVLRRTRPQDSDGVIRLGDLAINPTTYEVSLRGRRVNLRFKEYELLKLMATNAGRVYTRESLLNIIWGYDYFGGTRTVDVHIRRLRSKIEDADHPFIETIWNVGYRFRDLERSS